MITAGTNGAACGPRSSPDIQTAYWGFILQPSMHWWCCNCNPTEQTLANKDLHHEIKLIGGRLVRQGHSFNICHFKCDKQCLTGNH